MAGEDRDDPLAYGDFHERGPQEGGDEDYEGGERGIIGDTYRKIRDKYQQPQSASGSGSGLGASIFNKLQGAVHEIGAELNQRLSGREHGQSGQPQFSVGPEATSQNRFGSFARQQYGNDVKWYVDGCGYMWAVSIAIERARESIWILDWWLSPELYLRRPPSKNEQYRLDRMLQAAAQRGVKVNIIVYKEVTQALTLSSSHTKHHLENLHPNISVFRHPDHLPDAQTLQSSFVSSLQNLSLTAKKAASLPTDALKAIYGMHEDVILYWAHHEKLCLIDGQTAFMGGLDLCFGRWDLNQHPIADCHPGNLDDIVFPGQDWNNARIADFQDVAHWENNKLDRKTSSRMGWSDISISLHGPIVQDLREHFVQRWNFIYNEKYDVRNDTRYHRLALGSQVLGANPQQNIIQPSPENRPYQSQALYGHSSATGQGSQEYQPYRPSSSGTGNPNVNQSYVPYGQGQQPHPYGQQGEASHGQSGYQAYGGSGAAQSGSQQAQGQYFPPPPSASRDFDETEQAGERGLGESHHDRPHHHHERYEEEARALGGRFESGMQHLEDRYGERFESGIHHVQQKYAGHETRNHGPQTGGIPCQIVRSCSKWSHGVPTEHSIQNAYCEIIRNSLHFVYIENQFFITATGDKQKPVRNMIGAAIVERILRAARAGEKYKIIVVMPAIPAFAGDLKDDSSLGTRAIMEFQYNSINRGGRSIMETIADAGFDPTQYIRFYNLRNYDRINSSASMSEAERISGVSYEDARKGLDAAVELPADYPQQQGYPDQNYQKYQKAAASMTARPGLSDGRWDTVSECYMLNGPDIRSVPWENGELSEMDAFVSEELYVHSKVLIADDRVAICGSANLNDRSQLGDHDSEIACVIEDPTPLDSYMDGRPWRASKFAATLRRQLFRKHLGLIPAQQMERPNQNFEPIGVPNTYDFGSEPDRLVTDPLADAFLNQWNAQARQNTDAFAKVFHPVPHDDVRTWKDYDAFYERFFHEADEEADGKLGKKKPAKYQWGHVVAEDFSPGAQGVREVKDLLSTIKGTLVEMPLLFLIKEDIAKEGVSLNPLTEEIYT